MLAGLDGSEDAGVYKLSDDLAIVQTVDFFTPIVDDPRTFGQVAAVNSLSDIYAMGARPITAMNVVGFPVADLGVEVLRDILAGGLDVLREAGVSLVGGHSVKDSEPKYGLSVTGIVDPRRMLTNDGLRPGDVLVLTKAIGTGVIGTATKKGVADPASVAASTASMRQLNRAASEVAVAHGVTGCTDVTGFGLLGHLSEITRASRVRVRVDASSVPLLPGALEAARAGSVPGGSRANRAFFSPWVTMAEGVDPALQDLLHDAQTSGGLLMGVAPDRVDGVLEALRAAGVERAAAIGRVLERDERPMIDVAARG